MSVAQAPQGQARRNLTHLTQPSPPTPPPRADELHGIMAQNRHMLAERGEKLAQLQDKSQALQDDSEDFASMAKKLEEMYANKKWWQI